MKKIKYIPLFLLSLSLFSCNFKRGMNLSVSSSSSDSVTNDSSTSSNSIIEKELTVSKSPNKTKYVRYEELNLKGLTIIYSYKNELGEEISEEIEDYTVTDSKGNIVTSNYIFSEIGDFTFTVSKEGYKSTSFTINVIEVTNYKQIMTFTSLPTKTSYYENDTFSSDGLLVQIKTSYRNANNRTSTSTKTLNSSEYSLKLIKNKQSFSVKNYSFTSSDVGNTYSVSVSYDGILDTITNSFSISVVDKKIAERLKNLDKYEDKTINFTQDSKKMTVNFTNSNDTDTSDKGYYSPSEVVNEYNISSYSKRNAYGWRFTPSTGEVPFLVIPIVTPGDESKATQTNYNLINKAFFGDSSDLNFESLHSYYYQSSYGKLDIKGGVTDFFYPDTVSTKYSTISGYTESTINDLPQLALDWAKSTYNLNLDDYDTDDDGYIDGIWLIYLHDTDQTDTSKWWGYTSTTSATNGTISKPVANTFGWASLSFLDDTFVSSSHTLANSSCDAHVLIHETGHMLGLNDYYSYNTSNGYNRYDAVGNIDMMSKNLGDHSPYSKLLLGWVTPYIVYGNCSITISSCQSEDSLIVLPYDDKTYQKNTNNKVIFNTFDEYLILDYYTDSNLNASDYDAYSVTHISGNGGRLYHVDNRLAKYNSYNTSTGVANISIYSDPDSAFTSANSSDMLIKWITNSEAGSNSEIQFGQNNATKYDELRWISADKTKLSYSNPADNFSLFKTSSSFSISSFSSQFNSSAVNNTTKYLNSNKDFSTSFTISSIA